MFIGWSEVRIDICKCSKATEPDGFDDNMKLVNALAVSNEKDKKQLLNNIHSCSKAMETMRRAAKHICQLYGIFPTATMRLPIIANHYW